MENDDLNIKCPSTSKHTIVIVGGFGSGKTEVSVNLAKHWASLNTGSVTLVDLDLVNPYFRTREAIDEVQAMGIELIAPKGGKFYADLPILLPQVRGLLDNHEGMLILDVGGDAQGTKALGSISDLFKHDSYEMLMVLNSRRPQTSDLKSSIGTIKRIESAAGLLFTGLISNSHMIDETDADVVFEGLQLTNKVSASTKLPIFFISAKRDVLEGMDISNISCPVLPLTRSLLKPWERNN